MNHKILIIEDDKKLANLLRLYLEKDGYRVLIAHEGREGLTAARQRRPDLILLDLMLPGMGGLDVCRSLRADSKTPIIILTARSTEDDKLIGLDLGANDYVTKPFSPREVVARVRAVLRRTTDRDEGPSRFTVDGLAIDLTAHTADLNGQRLHLTPKEFRLLVLMATYPGRAFSRLELLEEVFGLDYEGLERTVDVHIMNLRKKIEADPIRPIFIQTVYGVGYRFTEGHHAQ